MPVAHADHCRVESSTMVTFPPWMKSGGLLTLTMLMENCAVACSPPSSKSVAVTIAVPKTLGAGVKVSVPVSADRVGLPTKRLELAVARINVRRWWDSLGVPARIAVAQDTC